MGSYRLILALLVALSHMKVTVFAHNPGVIAVVSFYLLSGYVMMALIEKYYKKPFNVRSFYIDRAARLFPQYLFYILLITLCIHIFDLRNEYTAHLTPGIWLLNLPIVPISFNMYYWGNGVTVIPQAWSLALEMTFYMVIPWIVRYATPRLIASLIVLSFSIFLAAYAKLISFDWWAYRLLPGTLFIFLAGLLFRHPSRGAVISLFFLFTTALALYVTGFAFHFFDKPFVAKEVLLGLIIGIPMLGALKDLKFSRLDEFLGNISYSVFLNHGLIIWIMEKYVGLTPFYMAVALGGSCLLALVSYTLVERPALAWRHRLRKKME